MTQSPKSQRQLLFSRVRLQKMGESLANNMQQLTKTEERMASSRLSSASSSSLHSLRRACSAVSFNKKSSSKQKMLREIIEKLRNSKNLIESSPVKHLEKQQKQVSSPETQSRKSKTNKLQLMMKDIKKCNQMSTKAVYSIKKNLNNQIAKKSQQKAENNKQDRMNSNIILLVNELTSLKQQLIKIKQENHQLVNIIVQQRQRQKQCRNCNCNCHFKGK